MGCQEVKDASEKREKKLKKRNENPLQAVNAEEVKENEEERHENPENHESPGNHENNENNINKKKEDQVGSELSERNSVSKKAYVNDGPTPIVEPDDNQKEDEKESRKERRIEESKEDIKREESEEDIKREESREDIKRESWKEKEFEKEDRKGRESKEEEVNSKKSKDDEEEDKEEEKDKFDDPLSHNRGTLDEIKKAHDRNGNNSMHTGKSVVRLSTAGSDVTLKVEYAGNKSWERTYPMTTKISECIKDFKADTKDDLPKNNKCKWKINGEVVDVEQTLSSVVSANSEVIDLSLEVSGLYYLADSYLNEFINKLNLIGKPFFNKKFKVIVFDGKEFKPSFRFGEQLVAETKINEYSKQSSYCNGKNLLFISGGDKTNNFWTVDLEKGTISKNRTGMPGNKKSHSMIYIPKRYVFIVGGNDKNVYYYDIEEEDKNNSFKSWSQLNEERKEPSLCLVNNAELYAFCGPQRSKPEDLTFEKTNLGDDPAWEVIKPKVQENTLFQQRFFAVCLMEDTNKILFFGGTKWEKKPEDKCIEYDPEANLLENSTFNFESMDFQEKTFLPRRQTYSLLIPDINDDEKKVCGIQRIDKKYTVKDYLANANQLGFSSNGTSNVFRSNIGKSTLGVNRQNANRIDNSRAPAGSSRMQRSTLQRGPLGRTQLQKSSLLASRANKKGISLNMPSESKVDQNPQAPQSSKAVDTIERNSNDTSCQEPKVLSGFSQKTDNVLGGIIPESQEERKGED